MINGRFAVASLPSNSAGMPPELVEEFPEGHKEAAERHEDSEDSPDWTEPIGIIPFRVQHSVFFGVAMYYG